MLILVEAMAAVLVSVQASAPAPETGSTCGAGDPQCVTASPEQMFALADQLYQDGNNAGAVNILQALTQDKHLELRSEARFRLAALLEQMGDLDGAANNLRALLAEQPDANPARLELARILDRLGRSSEAKKELARAEEIGLPPEVAVNVRRFASRLSQSTKRRGLTLEVTVGPDSNINRATSSPFIDTILAPFELSDDARKIDGIGASGTVRAYSRDPIGPINLLSRANGRVDLYDESRFNDLQLSADTGPEFAIGKTRLRPSVLIERRWFGGDLFAKGLGGDISLLLPVSQRSQMEFRAARVRQTIVPNEGQDGWRTSFDATYMRAFSPRVSGQVSIRHARLDARFEEESLRTWGGGAVLAFSGKAVTVYGEASYSATHGLRPLFLFGEKRRDRRWDLTAGAIMTKAGLGGFQPLVRASYSDSDADIVLWDYRRFRLDIGLTRNF